MKVLIDGGSGFLGINLFRNIYANFFYDGQNKKSKIQLATSNHSELNQRNFERKISQKHNPFSFQRRFP